MHLKGNIFARKLVRMEHNIKFPVICLDRHVRMHFYPWRMETSVRFEYVFVHVDGK